MTQPTTVPNDLPDLSPQTRRRGLLMLALAVAAVGFAIALQMGLQNNFVVEDIGLTPARQGQLEMWRETCGISALLLLALMAGLAEPLVGAAMLVLFGVGLGSYAAVPDFTWLVVASVIWSQGLHVWMPLPNSMALALAEPGRSGARLGQIQAAGAAGAAAGLLGALLLNRLDVPMRPIYLIAGAVAILGAVAVAGVPRQIKTRGPRLVIRKRYGLYYLLCLLEGWRKQIFVAFAGYLLVKDYGVPLSRMLMLWIAVQAIGWISSPWVGRLIDRLGERRVLMFYFASLTLFFTGYAFIGNVYLLGAIFVIDSAFFVFAMALTTYVSRIAPPAEHTATLSMGVAFNHVAAVTMPLVGGLLWASYGHQWTFMSGAVAAAGSVAAAMLIPPRQPARPAEPEPGPPAEPEPAADPAVVAATL